MHLSLSLSLTHTQRLPDARVVKPSRESCQLRAIITGPEEEGKEDRYVVLKLLCTEKCVRCALARVRVCVTLMMNPKIFTLT